MGFGKLRVINDDTIAPLGKFEMHSHKDFEIITIPLAGVVTHEDNLGNKGTVGAGEAQAMSAGTGVTHSECNASPTEPLELFQIWIEPRTYGAVPRYSQARFDEANRINKFQVLVSGDAEDGALAIYQNARILRADLGVAVPLRYEVMHKGNDVYILVIEGEVQIEGEQLQRRDAIGISEVEGIQIFGVSHSKILLIEVPSV